MSVRSTVNCNNEGHYTRECPDNPQQSNEKNNLKESSNDLRSRLPLKVEFLACEIRNIKL